MSTTEALNAELSIAFRQLYSINRSIAAERARGNAAGVAAMLPIYQDWLAKYKAVSVKLGQADFGTFDRFVLSTGEYVAKAAAELPDAVARLPLAIGSGLLKGAVPFIILAAAWLYFRGKL